MQHRQTKKFKQTEIGEMPEDWGVKPVREFCSEITSGGTPSRKEKKYWNNGTIFWLKTQELKDNKIYSTEEKITENGLENSSAKLFPVNTILMAMYGATIGRLGILKVKAATNQAVCAMITNPKIADYRFLFYSLLDKRDKLINLASGAAQQNLNQEIIKEFYLPFPPLPEQRAIAKILSAFDDKIELLQKMNKTLEAIGQAIFKHWFVDFEFPNEEGKPYKSSGGEMVYNEELGKEIPKGWEVKPIDEVADFLNGLPLQKYQPKNVEEYLPVIKIRELRQGITESSDKASIDIPKEYIVNDGDVLFSWSGSLEVVIWTGGKGALNQHLFKVTSKNYPKWFYYYWIMQYLPEYRHIAEGKATTMGHIQRHHLKNSLVLVPNDNIITGMDKILSPIIEKIIRINIESRNLSQLRDTLLPKLISGKIRVPVEMIKEMEREIENER